MVNNHKTGVCHKPVDDVNKSFSFLFDPIYEVYRSFSFVLFYLYYLDLTKYDNKYYYKVNTSYLP